jgi:hypothetical protein
MKKFTSIICLLISSAIAKAQYRTQEIGLQLDNDSFLAQGSDRYYTNGTFIHYRIALPFDEGGKLANKVLAFELGQKMYNPQSGFIPDDPKTGTADPTYIDRPFAGYLYLNTTYSLFFKKESVIKFGAQLGIVGPASLARQTQNFIHNTFGIYPPQGWETQITNTPVINISGEYDKLLARASFIDVSLNTYANAGTGFIGAGIGPVMRIGLFNKLFNSVITQSTVMNRNGVKANDQEIFFYYRPLANFVGYDVTVQGKLIGKKDPNSLEVTAKPEPLMISNQLGVAWNTGDRWTIDLSAIFHTKDVKDMIRVHQWGSMTFMYHFN